MELSRLGSWSRDVESQDRILKVLVLVLAVADTEGAGGNGPSRSPRPNFAIAKVCRIQCWKNAILKIHSFSFFKFLYKKTAIRQNIAFKGFLKNIFNFCV